MTRDRKTTEQPQHPHAGDVLAFGPFRLDPVRAALTCAGAQVPLRPKCFDVLRYLAENPDRLVTKEELLTAIWPGVVVTDSSLPQCLVEVRRALGEAAREMIITVPRRGYRFEATVRVLPANPEAAPTAATPLRSRVAPVMGLAAALLIIVGLVAWDPFAAGTLQPDAAQNGVAEPDQEVRAVEASVAYGEYAQGQLFQDRRAEGDLQRSIEYFRKAVELDPGLVEAWVGLAGSIWLDAKSRGDEDFASWGTDYKAALDRALDIDPAHPEAHARMANYYLRSGDIEQADEHFNIALQNGSDSSLIFGMAAGVAFWQRDLGRAVELSRRAVELEPLSFVRQANYGAYLFFAGNPALARKHLEIALDLNPQGNEDAQGMLMQSLLLLGDFEAAGRAAQDLPEGPIRDQGLALVQHATGDLPARDRYLLKLEADTSADAALRLAEAYAYLHRRESSRYWLESALSRNAAETVGSCMREFVLEAALSPFLVRLSAEMAGPTPTPLEVAQQLADHSCPSS